MAVGRDGAIYAYSFALDPNSGQPRTKFPGLVLAVGDDDTIYVQYNGICAFDPDGVLKWKSRASVSAARIVVGNDGNIYFGSRYEYKVRDPITGVIKYVPPPPGAPTYRVVALDPQSGSTKWSFNVRGAVSAVMKGPNRHDLRRVLQRARLCARS